MIGASVRVGCHQVQAVVRQFTGSLHAACAQQQPDEENGHHRSAGSRRQNGKQASATGCRFNRSRLFNRGHRDAVGREVQVQSGQATRRFPVGTQREGDFL